jgi:hypothetical protein
MNGTGATGGAPNGEPPQAADAAEGSRWVLNPADATASAASADDADPDRSDEAPERWRRLLN